MRLFETWVEEFSDKNHGPNILFKVSIYLIDFQSVMDGDLWRDELTGKAIGKEKEEEVQKNSLPLRSYFSTIASTGHASKQLPQSVHFSSLIT